MNRYNNFQNQPFQAITQLRELQSNRRLRMLEQQRELRLEQWSYLQDLMKIVPYVNIQQQADDHYRRELSQNLMMSEWMTEEPTDLEDFILVPCPKGIRCTLIYEYFEGKRNTTAKLYAKTGIKLFEVQTNIPQDSMLDCIYVKKNKTIYILDCMKYDGRDMTNCDTAFRRYWISSKFFECKLGVVDLRSQNTNMKLNFLEGYDFKTPHRVHYAFQRMPFFEDCAELDGFLFYHKDASYTPGETPLVLWLFPYMIDEVLTMYKIHNDYNCLKPAGYTNFLEYIEQFKAKQQSKLDKRFKNKKKRQETNTGARGGPSWAK